MVHWPVAFKREKKKQQQQQQQGDKQKEKEKEKGASKKEDDNDNDNEEEEAFPKDEQGNIKLDDISLKETWQAMEKLVEKGLVKSIGVCNYNKDHMEKLLKFAKIKPV